MEPNSTSFFGSDLPSAVNGRRRTVLQSNDIAKNSHSPIAVWTISYHQAKPFSALPKLLQNHNSLQILSFSFHSFRMTNEKVRKIISIVENIIKRHSSRYTAQFSRCIMNFQLPFETGLQT